MYTKLNLRSLGRNERGERYMLFEQAAKCFAFPADLFALFKTERDDRKQSRENIFQYPACVPFLTNTRFNIHFLYNLHFFHHSVFFFLLSFFCNSLSGISAMLVYVANQTRLTLIDHISAS